MSRNYYTLTDEPVNESDLASLDGNYQLWISSAGDTILKEIYLDNRLSQVHYSNSKASQEELKQQHLGAYPGIPFNIIDKADSGHTSNYRFDGNGVLQGKVVTYTKNDRVDVEENYNAQEQLTGGTYYILEDNDVLYALEFNGDREFFNCYDFATGDTGPLNEVLDQFRELLF